MPLEQTFNAVRSLFNALHQLGRDDRQPDSRMVSGVLFCLSNDHLIDLLRYLLANRPAREASRRLSKRSSLFDKLIIMKEEDSAHPWVIRLHTYQVLPGPGYERGRRREVRGRHSNLGEDIRDDEDNTHFHRWQLGSRFISGGFNNVTWDVSEHGEERNRQTRYTIPPTSSVVGQQAREARVVRDDEYVTVRRSEFYIEGDVIAYPIVDAHSVGTSAAPFVGTTMTFAHTGREQLDESYFFLPRGSRQEGTVQQLSYEEDEHIAAIRMAIVRLQLIGLNKQLAARCQLLRNPFVHMNSFETELLPRIAELLVLHISRNDDPMVRPRDWDWRDWVAAGRTVDLDEEALFAVAAISSENRASLVDLILLSQRHLFAGSFVADLDALAQFAREHQALTERRQGRLPVNARRFDL